MESVTYQDFKHRTGEAIAILFFVVLVEIISIVKYGPTYEYITILISSSLCIIFLWKLVDNVENYINSGDISKSKGNLLEFVIIVILGCLSFYLFFIKGLYAMILVFSKFSVKLFLGKLLVLFLSWRLVYCTSKIHTVYKSIKQNICK